MPGGDLMCIWESSETVYVWYMRKWKFVCFRYEWYKTLFLWVAH